MERLRHIREQAGYSQQDLADESGASQHTISELELGRRKPQGRTLRKLAKVLGVEVADLREDTDSPKAEAPPSSIQPPLNGFEDERRIAIDYNACRAALDGFCDYWNEILDADRLDPQTLDDFDAAAKVLAPTYLELWSAEKTELGPQEDAGEPVFHSERSALWPAIDRFIALGIHMDRIGREQFSRHDIAKVTDIFTKKAS